MALALVLSLPPVALAQSPGDGCRVVVDYEDAAIGEFAVFGSSKLVTRAVGYVWSRAVPAGTTLASDRARAIVLRSGAPPDDGWVTETVHVRRDYERLYGEAPPAARGVAVLTDADQTRSRAVGDYGTFRVCPDQPG